MSKHWRNVKMGEILERSQEVINPLPDREYREITVRLWGKGVIERGRVLGASLSSRRFIARENQFIISRIDARNGASGLVPASLDGALVTNDFPLLNLKEELVAPSYFGWLTKTQNFVEMCQRASEGTTNRVRLKEDSFLSLEIPLPPLTEQRRIVAKIEELASEIRKATSLVTEVDEELNTILLSTFHQIVSGAPLRTLGAIAPLERRPVIVQQNQTYAQIAVRSFGKGTFDKPAVNGAEITWQKPYYVKGGDVLISNIKAWEGAVAVVEKDHDRSVVSHRYLTCVPKNDISIAAYVAFFLLTPEGLHQLGEASPGSADRNRTLSTKKLCEIKIPCPEIKKQVWFESVLTNVKRARDIHKDTAAELEAFLPAILDKAFKGEL